MKIGVSGNFSRAKIAKNLGYDFIEENLFRLHDLDDDAFKDLVKAYEALDMPISSFNSFFAPDFPLYTESALEHVKRYAEEALSRAELMGATVCVLGSGKARHIPNGVDRVWGVQRFVDVISVCGDIADKHGIRIAVEPLKSEDTNLVHTVSDAALLARRSNRKNVGALVDFFHFFMNKETDSGLLCAADVLFHVHVARDQYDRLAPQEQDISVVKRWASMLKEIHYEGNLVLECKFLNKEDPEEELRMTKPILEIFREI